MTTPTRKPYNPEKMKQIEERLKREKEEKQAKRLAEKKALKESENVEVSPEEVHEEEPIEIPSELSEIPPDLDQREVIWTPHPKQIEFITATEDEVLFSGGRGTGKSECLLFDPLRYIDNKNFKGLILRNTVGDLEELIERAHELYNKLPLDVNWLSKQNLFVFPSGAKIKFGYCDSEEDIARYKGQQYTWLGIDEITHFKTANILDKLKGSLRTKDKDLKVQVRATTNPDGPGHHWVKNRWVNQGPSSSRITIEVKNQAGDVLGHVTRRWIHSVLADNPTLMESDPNYAVQLASFDNEVLRRRWVEGDWDVSESTAFSEFHRDKHVCKPFPIPHGWHKFRSCDWGYGSMAVCLWLAIDHDYNMYVYRELTATKVNADKFAEMIKIREEGEGINYGILDFGAFASSGQIGETPGETLQKAGLKWRAADKGKGARAAGKLLLHRALTLNDVTGQPGLKIFDSCIELIKELGELPLDPNNPDDVDTKACDHAYDALRYALLSRPHTRANRHYRPAIIEAPIIMNPKIGY